MPKMRSITTKDYSRSVLSKVRIGHLNGAPSERRMDIPRHLYPRGPNYLFANLFLHLHLLASKPRPTCLRPKLLQIPHVLNLLLHVCYNVSKHCSARNPSNLPSLPPMIFLAKPT